MGRLFLIIQVHGFSFSEGQRFAGNRGLLGQSDDKLGNAQWIGHVLKGLQLIDPSQRKHHVRGKLDAIEHSEVLDMMQRYDVSTIEDEISK